MQRFWAGAASVASIGLLCAAALAAERSSASPALELVETAPIETTLDHPDLPKAADVWLEMIRGATQSIDFGEFYATGTPNGRLEPIIAAIESAAARGVRVRFIVDAGFSKKEPETLERLARIGGVEVHRYDWAARAGGGIHHAKYFIVDQREAFLGSQNFDWRSLEHIQELGVRIRVPALVRSLSEVFEMDWSGKAPPAGRDRTPFPVEIRDGDASLRIWLTATPKGLLPDEDWWSLPRLVRLIEKAKRTVRIQLLTYQSIDREGFFPELEVALRGAAARGVAVELLVADWGKRSGTIEGLKSLETMPNIAVKLVTIPQASSGFIPYARVAHAKYLVVDGESAWIGTSNWERSYFYKCRNVGLIVEGATFAGRLDRFFVSNWQSAYAEKVDPCASYVPARIAK